MRKRLLKLLTSAFLIMGVLAGWFPDGGSYAAAAAGAKMFSLQVDGLIRTYTVFEPSIYSGQKKVPLVVVLHGVGGVGEGVIRETAWDRKAEQEGFLVVFPDAMRPHPKAEPSLILNPQVWNDGSGRGDVFLREVNDVKFLSLMLDQLTKTYAIDQKAVYLTGFSNGASMGFRAASELPGRFAALAAVSGHYWPSAGNAELKQPIPTIFICGMADPLNPFNGGSITLPWGFFEQPPLMSTIVNWAEQNGVHQELTPTAGMPGVKVIEGVGGKNVPVRAYIVEGLGHMWPGGEAIFPEQYIGTDPGTLNATDVIWDFFAEIKSGKVRGI